MDRWLTKAIAAVTLVSSLSCASPHQLPPSKTLPQVLAASRSKLAETLQNAENNVEKIKAEAQFVYTLKKDDPHYASRLQALVTKIRSFIVLHTQQIDLAEQLLNAMKDKGQLDPDARARIEKLRKILQAWQNALNILQQKHAER